MAPVIFLLLILFSVPATAQQPPERYIPTEPEEPMISLKPEELPEPDLLIDERNLPPSARTLIGSDDETDPKERAKIRPEQFIPRSIDESKLPPGHVARAGDCFADEEKVEGGLKKFGIEPMKIPWGDSEVDWIPTICKKKGAAKR